MIYLVEDDTNIRELVTYTLNSMGLPARGFDLPSLFWKEVEKERPALVLLDIMLPEQDGLHILQKLRNAPETAKVPVIMLTAKAEEYDKVKGFDLGADDYIPKPFGMMELVARVKALLRRTEDIYPLTEYTIGSLYVNTASHVVRVQNTEITLTHKEFELLKILLENRNIVLTREQLLSRVWGYSFDGESRTVDVHVKTLRQKLGKAGDIIETIRGVGYKISK